MVHRLRAFPFGPRPNLCTLDSLFTAGHVPRTTLPSLTQHPPWAAEWERITFREHQRFESSHTAAAGGILSLTVTCLLLPIRRRNRKLARRRGLPVRTPTTLVLGRSSLSRAVAARIRGGMADGMPLLRTACVSRDWP